MATPQNEEKAPATTSEKPGSVSMQHKPTQPAPPPPPPTTTNSTNKSILDNLLYRSLQSRFKQAQFETLEMAPSLQNQDKAGLQEKKQRWMDTVIMAEQDKKAVESVVKGILSNHRSKRPSFQIDQPFEQRLHLCQLTNLIFGRRDCSADCTKRRRHHHHHHHHHHLHQHLHQHHQRQSEHVISDEDTKRCRWTQMIQPHHCRRHRLQQCELCGDLPTPSSSFPPGLLEAIPTFLKTSADLLRRTLETNHDNKKKPMIFAGQKVMGGGMPPRWYDLFLELLTQAAIECYLCDMQTGLESIYEIFSYGDVEDEDEPEHHTDDEDDDDESESEDHHHATTNDNKIDTDDDDWSVEAADHHLLFPKTRTMYLFKTQVREREKEILVIEENVSLHQHLQALAKRYPLDNFEKNMGEYIQMIHHTMAIPDLGSKDGTTTTTENDETTMPSIYKYPCDGSLLMPELPEDGEDTSTTDQQQQEEEPHTNKRRASVDLEKEDSSKKHG